MLSKGEEHLTHTAAYSLIYCVSAFIGDTHDATHTAIEELQQKYGLPNGHVAHFSQLGPCGIECHCSKLVPVPSRGTHQLLEESSAVPSGLAACA